MSETTDSIRAVLSAEAAALTALVRLADEQAAAIERACALILDHCGQKPGGGLSPGRLVVTGMGKAGHIGTKLSATFASTGTPSLVLHPAEARHGDLGMVQEHDVVLALSNSGSSEEIVALLPSLTLIGAKLIAIVGRSDSPLGRHADVALSIGRVVEACPLGLAPSTSTTAMLALGDALALTVQKLRRFTPEQYARYHPGGALGRKLMTCGEAMRTGDRVAAVDPHTPLIECLRAIGRARAGSVVLVDAKQQLVGICTDGDLRRALANTADPAALLHGPVRSVATVPCKHVRSDELLQAALHLCAAKKINELPVVDGERRLVGLLDLQDLVDRGFEVGS
ncbi:MAG: KpsF/GutQ family sugar-phosphate isomerase [Planctomycetota bacterium]